MHKQTSLSQLSRNWLAMADRYRPSAFWFWNAEMSPSGIEASLAEMAKNGVREILIHPSHGMTVEYLSDIYYDRFRLALETARSHGLKVWVYDEYAWPSGTAGERLLLQHPEYCGWLLVFDRDENGKISAKPTRQDRVLDSAVGAPWSRHTPGYLDTLRREAVAQFLEMTYQRVYEECREYFDDVIVGFFTDEPVMMIGNLREGCGMWDVPSVPWTPEIPTWFQERFGYDIEPHYSELAGGNDSAVKRDYWTLLKEIHTEAYHGQIGRWCRAHGVQYTGHLFSEDYPLNHTRFTGSLFHCLRHMDIPGIDYLGVDRRPEDRFWEQVLVASVARHIGCERVFCEAYNLMPMDTRLADMLHLAQLFGIHGVDDIAMMAFRQASDGVRKRCQWPTLFTDSPWWEFYPSFRDAFARSLALTSLGTRKARYALLYPQEQLEQTDAFTACIDMTDPGSKMIRDAGLAVYAAHETFEFVFPEILSEASVEDGRIVFPHAKYDAILAPSDVMYSEESKAQLHRIQQAGGQVIEHLEALQEIQPSWQDKLAAQISPDPKACRIYRYNYSDGTLFAVRNVTEHSATLNVSTGSRITEWDPLRERCVDRGGKHESTIEPFRTMYFSISDTPFGSSEMDTKEVPLFSKWIVSTERPNMSYLANLKLCHPEKGWMQAANWGYACFYRSECDPRFATTIPTCFSGMTTIPMRGEFLLADLPDSLGILFEREHLDSLSINGTPIHLNDSVPMPVWDSSCHLIPIRSAIRMGRNTVEGALRYGTWETSIRGNGFLTQATTMPSCDVRLAGDYRLLHEKIVKDEHVPLTLPLDLGEAGYSQYTGIAVLTSQIEVSGDDIIGLAIDPIREDAIEVLLDGVPVGRSIARPYRIMLSSITPGRHELQLRIASTSANIMDHPVPWGIKSIRWMLRR